MFCPECGAELKDDARFCENCGSKLSSSVSPEDDWAKEEENSSIDSSGEDFGSTPEDDDYRLPEQSKTTGNSKNHIREGIMKQRNIALCIVFSIITCGIYMLYWIYKLNEEMSELAGEEMGTSGAMVIVLSIVTCNIYLWFWLYKKGEQLARIKAQHGQTGGSDSILFLILAIFGLDIVDLAIMQDAINNYGA